MRVQPWEVASDLLPLDDGPPSVSEASATSDYLATYSRELVVSGMGWIANRNGRYAVLPRRVVIGYRQASRDGAWAVTSVEVVGPARSEGSGSEIGEELVVVFTWGEMGRIDRPADVPAWLGEQIERCRP